MYVIRSGIMLTDVISLPEYKIEIPSERLIRCLGLIDGRNDSRITKRKQTTAFKL
jgi:hypothetical protein